MENWLRILPLGVLVGVAWAVPVLWLVYLGVLIVLIMVGVVLAVFWDE